MLVTKLNKKKNHVFFLEPNEKKLQFFAAVFSFSHLRRNRFELLAENVFLVAEHV